MYNLFSIKGGVCAPNGFFADSASAGLRSDGSDDIASIYSDELCNVASVFTTNKMLAAPIRHFLAYKNFQTNFVLMNAKNANAMTGQNGIDDINFILDSIKEKHSQISNPVMSSTGVIGVPLNTKAIIDAAISLNLSNKNSANAAKAIMTTDTYSKEIAFKIELEDGKSFTIGAMAKGAGMIDPSMATMLCFITTDADITSLDMQKHLDKVTKTTFNAISVDGDTSTNDTVLLLSNKKSGAYDSEAFEFALERVMKNLALLMVKDGEGAKKLVAFNVTGAATDKEAETVAKALSDSLLVKTAIFGEDPNWGRVASTVGASGVECSEESLSVSFEDVVVYQKGKILFDSEQENRASKIMKRDEFSVNCDLGIAKGSFTAYGCDLGHDYVSINADYRT